MTNIGIDFLALHNRLSLTADWYIKNTKDILLQVPIPISTGGANDPYRNAGKSKTKVLNLTSDGMIILTKICHTV